MLKQKIKWNRKFVKYDEDFFQESEAQGLSDQQKRLPQPSLCKEAMTDHPINLPNNFDMLSIEQDFLAIINNRKSHRVYTEQSMSLLELAYLLWTTQGVKSIRGNNYATLRTVPAGGARHEFETYLLVHQIDGLEPGIYHFLPLTFQIERINDIPEWETQITNSLEGQKWATKANVVFFWSCVPYRSEWRYSHFAHRVILMDIGYVSQNLYLACESIGLGTCAIGAFDPKSCTKLLQLDGEEEFPILCSPVGTVSEEDKQREDDFYAFLKNQK
ncbi:MAG: SagB/ThcOx family dehydrogenase [Bacilli bacterium]|nr:SagB/ThcOx family dehydrogenase [Bacilli bacterium]